MTGPRVEPVGDLRCSTWARAEAVDPIATIGCYSGFLVVEIPPPWPRDASLVAELEDLVPCLREAGIRLQLVTSLDGNRIGEQTRHVALHLWDGRSFPGRELAVPPRQVASSAAALVEDTLKGAPTTALDVLVCGHGSRDRCCGSLGTALQLAFAKEVPGCAREQDTAATPGSSARRVGLRCWRTSHTGGHRFAPTALLLPAGTAWAYLDAGELGHIVHQDQAASGFAAKYRGCAGLRSRMSQAVERELLCELGWELFGLERAGEDLGDGRVRFVAGPEQSFEATVTRGRSLPVPVCGQTIVAATKHEHELVVSGLRRTS